MAAYWLHAGPRSLCCLQNVLRSTTNTNSVPILFKKLQKCRIEQSRLKGEMSKKKVKYYRELYHRRMELGPEPEKHRKHELGVWDYKAEVTAFGERLGEKFDMELLMNAFLTHEKVEEQRKSMPKEAVEYLNKTEEKSEDIQGEKQETEDADDKLDKKAKAEADFIRKQIERIDQRDDLIQTGEEIAGRYIKAFLRYSYPQMFEEGICAVHDFLMTDEMLCSISKNLGFQDLIRTPNHPPTDEQFVTCFKAVIGALAESTNIQRAELFVRDFIIVQLIAKDINEIWELVNPMGLLTAMLQADGRGLPEPRLLWSSSSETIMSLYHVGVYSDKKLIGKSPGETVVIAEEMAARDAIKNLCKISDSRTPLKFDKRTENMELKYDRTNRSLQDVLSMKTKEIEAGV